MKDASHILRVNVAERRRRKSPPPPVPQFEPRVRKLFMLFSFSQSLRTRAIQIQIKILKMFCRGNRATMLVSCLSYFLLAYKLRCPCNQITA